MHWKNTRAGYGWISIAFHWSMLLLIVGAYATMELKGIFPRGSSSREAMATWHYVLGLWVFVLVWPRLLLRLAGSSPAIEPPLPAWQVASSRVMHWTLYAMMIGLPLVGWLMLSAKGKPVPFLGAELPALVGKSQKLAKWLEDIHEAGAKVGYFLIGLHAVAALHHHYVRRDNTLRLILPSR